MFEPFILSLSPNMKGLFVVCLLFALVAVVVHAQPRIPSIVLIDDPYQENFIFQFVCIYKDNLSGSATVIVGGGLYANDNGNDGKVLLYEDSTQTGIISAGVSARRSFSDSGTYWIYLKNPNTGVNVDYLQVEVVSADYTGDCKGDLTASGPPSGWTSGYPPAYTPSSN